MRASTVFVSVIQSEMSVLIYRELKDTNTDYPILVYKYIIVSKRLTTSKTMYPEGPTTA